jgi:hypothetical protein
MPDIGLHRPPIRIGPASARGQARVMLRGSGQVADGADQFQARQGIYASVGLRLRIQKGTTTPNSTVAAGAVIPLGRTRRKAGFPPTQVP